MKLNPENHNPSPDYLRELVAKSGLSQNKVAESIGVAGRTFRDYLNGNHKSQAPYPVQFTLESLVVSKEKQ